jgi:hypothetical protein
MLQFLSLVLLSNIVSASSVVVFNDLSPKIIENRGIPFNSPNISNIFEFLEARRPLAQKVQKEHPFALMRLQKGAALPLLFQGVEHVTSIGNMLIQSKTGLENAAQQIEYLVKECHVLPIDFLSIAAAYRETYKDFGVLSGSSSSSSKNVADVKTYNPTFVPHEKHLMKQFYLHNTLLYYPNQLNIIQHHLSQNKTVLQQKSKSFWENVERDFLAGHVVVVDRLLSDWALDLIYDFCLKATIYWEEKIQSTYLGSYSQFGLYYKMFQMITKEFRNVMPNIIGTSFLRNFWSYKYNNDSNDNHDQTGVPPHADLAKVNLNLWITPDEANLNQLTGGMIVYNNYRVHTKEQFATLQEQRFGTKHFVDNNDGEITNVPYKRNRMVIFDSSLVHQTSSMHFKRGYKNKRINLTWLFGHPIWEIKEKENEKDRERDEKERRKEL